MKPARRMFAASQAEEASFTVFLGKNEAEGWGFEPQTHCWASDFESDRWPIRLPSVSVDTRSLAPSVCGENRADLRPSASCVWPSVVRQTLSAAAWQRGGSRPPDAEGWRCSRVGADRVPVCRSRGFGGLRPLPLRRCGYRSRAVRRARLERRRDRHGLARARPSRWAGRGRARRAEAQAVRPDA
jgi:hypothetical protein